MADAQRIEPGPGQESVWDYPRPPRLERTARRLRVMVGDHVIADTTKGWRVLETSQPPAMYIPVEDLDNEVLEATLSRTFCEWKGQAVYWTVRVGARCCVDAGWSYPSPTTAFEPIRDHLAFYPQRVDTCMVDDEVVQPNQGSFYGGWVTSEIVGPFKGGAGTAHW